MIGATIADIKLGESRSEKVAGNRLPELDLLRFIAAAAVVLYHWTYRPIIAESPSPAVFEFVQSASRYGYLGVDLFFMISGFVILWSASSRGASSFLVSRFSRLYPTFWVCVALTGLVLYLSGRTPPSLGVKAFLVNLTMIPGAIGVPYVDGVYWTLFVELKFYLLVFLALLLLPWRLVEPVLYGWLVLATLAFSFLQFGVNSLPILALKSLTLVPFAQLFIAGATFFLVWRDGATPARCLVLLICLLLSIANAVNQEPNFVEDRTSTTRHTTIVISLAMFAVFVAMSLKIWRLPASPIWQQLGAATYPLYLLHNAIGKTIWWAIPESAGPWLRLLVVALGVGVITWAVAAYVERRWSPRLNVFLQHAIAPRLHPSGP